MIETLVLLPPDARSSLILMAVPLDGISVIIGEPVGTRFVPWIETVAPASGTELGVTEVMVGVLYQFRVCVTLPSALVTTIGYDVPLGSDGAVKERTVPVFDVTGTLTPLMVMVDPVRLCPLMLTTVPVVLASKLLDGDIDEITGAETACTVSLVADPRPVRV